MLYAWCRYTDDQIDECDSSQPERIHQTLNQLRADTRLAFEGHATAHPVFQGLQAVVKKYRIPQVYADELLNGYQMDIEKNRYLNTKELDLYCYRVAGVVGLMMCHIMGISDQSALEKACQMGMAMQMTNIARDIQTDYKMNRIYLPLEWLQEFGIDPRSLLDVSSEARLHLAVTKLVQRADDFYQRADSGLTSLPLRAALAVSGARWIYSEIGRRVVRSGTTALRQRTFVSFGSKIRLLGRGLLMIAGQLPQRLHKPFQRVEINQTWRLS